MGKRGLCLTLHIGAKDIQDIFEKLGHTLDILSISGHNHIMGWPNAKVDVINERNWMNLDQNMCDAFYERYKDEFKVYDFFVSFYSPTFSMLFEKFNKPIIVQVPMRFETPFFTNTSKWQYFNEYLMRQIDNKNIIPLVNNLYDQKYLNLFTGREWELIPSLCEYTKAQYTGKNNSFLLCSKVPGLENFIKVPGVVNKDSIKGYSWQDIADYKAIIYFPYSNTLMSLFEQYTANIPLLVPSKEFLFSLWRVYRDKGLMGELSWNQVFKMGSKAALSFDHLDPNNYEDEESFRYWSSLSDFYDEERMPHIIKFDSFFDLEDKLFSLDFSEISGIMKAYNITRREGILNQWKEVLKKI